MPFWLELSQDFSNWLLKIPIVSATMGLTMIFEIAGSKLAGHYGFVQIDNKYAVLGSSPNIVIIFALSVVLFYFILNRTVFSFQMCAVGSNEGVARNSGIKADLVKCKVYCIWQYIYWNRSNSYFKSVGIR